MSSSLLSTSGRYAVLVLGLLGLFTSVQIACTFDDPPPKKANPVTDSGPDLGSSSSGNASSSSSGGGSSTSGYGGYYGYGYGYGPDGCYGYGYGYGQGYNPGYYDPCN